MDEVFLALVIAVIVLAVPVVVMVLAIVAFVRTTKIDRLARRVEHLEALMRRGGFPAEPSVSPVEITAPEEKAAPAGGAEEFAEPVFVEASVVPFAEPPAAREAREPFQWELFIGQKALGWVAIVLLIFAAAFFLRYAYQNNWIGPVGRVAIGALVGVVMVVGGLRYDRRGWRLFGQMLTAGGIVVLYLATYSAFGFYHLLPQKHAGAFLVVIVALSMIVAALYRSLAIGLMAVIGGLLTPLLMRTERDSYVALFTYLAVLDAGTVLLTLLTAMPALGTVALIGTQFIYWIWYQENYHPQKLEWALGFQVVVYAVFLARSLLGQRLAARWQTWEGLVLLVANAVFFFRAFYVLTNEDYRVWMGTAAIAMATIYALLARLSLTRTARTNWQLFVSLALAVGFAAWAFPLQADARWVAFGWAAMAAALWWFGLRVSAPALRVMGLVVVACAVVRLLFFDVPHGTREPFVPIFNEFALPSIGVAVCILGSVVVSYRFAPMLSAVERFLIGFGGVSGNVLLLLVLSIECYGYFDAQATRPGVDAERLRWLGQLSMSVLWAVYASGLLALGFRIDLARLRWMAIALYAVTVGKVFLVDMANLRQIYRILAFFILAIVLGLAARAYQRLRPSGSTRKSEEVEHASP